MQPPGWTGYQRRIDTQMLREVAWPLDQRPLAFICGPTPFVETAAAGILQEIFPFDMTLVQATRTHCGTSDVIGALAIYMHGMGTIVHCPSCDSVLIRVAHTKGRNFLDMRGVRVLQISAGA